VRRWARHVAHPRDYPLRPLTPSFVVAPTLSPPFHFALARAKPFEIYLAWGYRRVYRPMLAARASPTEA
jgi:hypothetical protein